MGDKKNKSQPITVFFAVIFVMGWLGIMFTLFPVSNPLTVVGGTSGAGIFYGALLAFGLMIALLLMFAIKSSIRDILESLGNEIGVDLVEIGGDYKKIVREELQVMAGKRQRPSDHHFDEDE